MPNLKHPSSFDPCYLAPVRKGVRDKRTLDNGPFSLEFATWCDQCLVGQVELLDQDDGPGVLAFAHEQDQVAYLLTWTQEVGWHRILDAAAFYAPYIPLAYANVANTQPQASPSTVKFVTRYAQKI